MQESDSMQKYVISFVEIINKLTEMLIDLGNPVKVIMLLASLPRRFDHIVLAMQTRDKLPLFDNSNF